jgi:DNA polymerase epsilon subunit 2
MPVSRQQIIIRVFRKYSHSLGPEELEYLDEVLKEHDISDEDVEMSIELIAKEYNKQDGSSLVSHLGARGAHAHFFSERCYHEGLG